MVIPHDHIATRPQNLRQGMANHGGTDMVKRQLLGDVGARVINDDLLALPFLALPIAGTRREDLLQYVPTQHRIIEGEVDVWDRPPVTVATASGTGRSAAKAAAIRCGACRYSLAKVKHGKA